MRSNFDKYLKAQTLFGTHWKATLATLMGVHKRTVQRWVTGELQEPQDLEEKINATWNMWRQDND